MNNLLLMMGRVLARVTPDISQTMGPDGGGTSSSSAPSNKLTSISEKVHEILSGIAGPILIALGSIGVIYMVVLGVQYAKSEGDDKRATVKRRLVNLAIGIVAIFALAAICLAVRWDIVVPQMFGYMDKVSH